MIVISNLECVEPLITLSLGTRALPVTGRALSFLTHDYDHGGHFPS